MFYKNRLNKADKVSDEQSENSKVPENEDSEPAKTDAQLVASEEESATS